MAGWTQQPSLIDWDSPFLRGVNESYRTWCLKYQKIQQLLSALKHFPLTDGKNISGSGKEHGTKLSTRISQLRAMTIQQDDLECFKNQISASVIAEMIDRLERLPEKRKAVDELEASMQDKIQNTDADDDNDGDTYVCLASDQETEDFLAEYRQNLDKLEDWQDEMFTEKYIAETDLKEYETRVLADWQEKKQASECWTKRYEMLQGLKFAMRAAIERYDFRLMSPEDRIKLQDTKSSSWDNDSGDPQLAGASFGDQVFCMQANLDDELVRQKTGRNKMSRDVDAGNDGTNELVDEWEPFGFAVHALSDVLAEGVADPKDREAILKREHVGSKDHPDGCRPCHFQGGLCWKGLTCSFCHICPKPKRKSKHQRDVDKRRQERYRQVRDDLGAACLDELTKIDDGRRQMMTISEELKKRVKDSYASGHHLEVDSAIQAVKLMQRIVDEYNTALLNTIQVKEELQMESEPETEALLDEQNNLNTSAFDEEESTATFIPDAGSEDRHGGSSQVEQRWDWRKQSASAASDDEGSAKDGSEDPSEVELGKWLQGGGRGKAKGRFRQQFHRGWKGARWRDEAYWKGGHSTDDPHGAMSMMPASMMGLGQAVHPHAYPWGPQTGGYTAGRIPYGAMYPSPPFHQWGGGYY